MSKLLHIGKATKFQFIPSDFLILCQMLGVSFVGC